MKRRKISVFLTALLIAVAVTLAACGGATEGEKPDAPKGPFDFDGNYVAPELTIDGKGDDAQWQSVQEPLAVYGHNNAVTVKAYRGEKAMFFLFDVADTVLLTNGNANDDTVTEGDSIELYIDTLADGGLRPRSDDFQINLGIHGKTRIMQGANGLWGGWNGLIDYEVDLRGTLNDGAETNDTGYGLEVMVPYAQIGIEKDDTVGIAFGQVDKIGLGNESGKDWDWYGWTYNGNLVEPQTIDNYILWDKDGNLLSRDDEEKPNAEIGGTVIDATSKRFVQGATVTTTIGGEEKSVTTDGNGFFSFGKVNSNQTYTVTVSKNGYIANEITFTRGELRAANGGVIVKNVELTALADAELTTVTGTVKNVLNGNIEGARVRIDGTAVSALTDKDGAFTVENVPVNDEVTLVVTKEGFGESKTSVARSALTVNGTSALGDVNLNLPYAELGTVSKPGGSAFANATVKVARAISGVEILLSGTGTFRDGQIELFIDTKATVDGPRGNDTTCYGFQLKNNGTVLASRCSGGGISTENVKYILDNRNENGFDAMLLIPYELLDIHPLEVFGIAAGQWVDVPGDWCNLNDEPNIADNATNFIRIAADNAKYRAKHNNVSVALSGNVGVRGATVKAGGVTAVSGADGSWEINCAVDAASTVTVQYGCTGYIAASTVIPAGTFFAEDEWSENKTLTEQKVLVSGKVTNRNGGAPVANVTVTAKVTKSDGTTENLSTITANDGSYTIEDVTTFADVTFTFVLTDYETETVTVTAEIFATLSDSHVLNAQITATADIKEMSVSGTVKDISGIVEAPVVKITDNRGEHAPEVTDGKFGLTTMGAFTVTVSKSGYITKEISVTLDDLTGAEYDLGDIFLARDYTALGGKISDLTGYVTRDEKGFVFKFEAESALNGTIELFVDTKASNGRPERNGLSVETRNNTDYRFDLRANGTIGIENWGGGTNKTVPADGSMTYKVTGKEGVFTLPYAFLSVARTEIIGISLGYIPEGGSWTGWEHETLKGANGTAFVKPEMTADYLRIGVDNALFENGVNYTVEELDVRDYKVQFGMNADMFYAKAERDENGVTFSFVTLGDFNKDGAENEMVLVYFDFVTDTQHKGENGWPNGADYLIKISSDGTVYGSNGEGKPKGPSWWSATAADKTGDVVDVNRNNGITKFTFSLTYDKLKSMGLGADDEIFGFVMREASHNAGDHKLYDPWYDCYFDGACRDAAANGEFIRLSADGIMYTASNNDPAAANAR